MVEHRVVAGKETKPGIADVLGDGRAQSAKGGDVVKGADEQRPDHNLGMDSGATEVGAVPLFQRGGNLGEVQLLIDPNQQVVGVDEIS
jgi:hypothetical protein